MGSNEQNKEMSKIEPETKLTVTRGEGKEGKQEKEGEGSSQGTCMKDPWTWTTGWGLIVGAGMGGGCLLYTSDAADERK